jgi:hypothetical protein
MAFKTSSDSSSVTEVRKTQVRNEIAGICVPMPFSEFVIGRMGQAPPATPSGPWPYVEREVCRVNVRLLRLQERMNV